MYLKTLFWGRVCRLHQTAKGISGAWRLSTPARLSPSWNNPNQTKTKAPPLIALPFPSLWCSHSEQSTLNKLYALPFPASPPVFSSLSPAGLPSASFHGHCRSVCRPCLPWSQIQWLPLVLISFYFVAQFDPVDYSLLLSSWLPEGFISPGFLLPPQCPDWLFLISPASKYYFS